MTDKTFEVGKAYKHKYWGDIIHVIIDYRPFGIPKDTPYYTFGSITFDSQHNFEFSDIAWVGLYEIKDYEECIVKNLKPGDKVLLRRGCIRTCGIIHNYLDRVTIQLLEDNGVIHTSVYQNDGNHETWAMNDVIAILERAKPKLKLEVGEYYKNKSAIVRITGVDRDDKYPFIDQYNRQYLEDGTCDNGLDKYRLVKKVKVTEVEQ